MALAKAFLDPDIGYVYETDDLGNLVAIRFIGTIIDGNPDSSGNLLDASENVINPNWEWKGAMRLEGADLAALPPADPATDGTSSDPRYQAIMYWLGQAVKAQHAAYAAIKAAELQSTPHPSAEVAALPALTPSVMASMGL